MLAEGTGSSIYIFTTILAIFLLGIALGSFLYRRLSRPEGERLGTLGLCLAGVGVLAQATVVLGSGMVGQVPFVVRTVVVLLPATILMGYAFPLAGRLATPSAEAAGGSVGLLYAANTGGSILGSFGAAFVLAGTLGTNGSILLLGGLNLLAGAVLFAADPVGARTPGRPRAGPGRAEPGAGAAGRGRAGRAGGARAGRVVARPAGHPDPDRERAAPHRPPGDPCRGRAGHRRHRRRAGQGPAAPGRRGRDDVADRRHQAHGLPVQGAAARRPGLPGDRVRHGRHLPLRAPARAADRRRRAVPDRPQPHARVLPGRRPLPATTPRAG